MREQLQVEVRVDPAGPVEIAECKHPVAGEAVVDGAEDPCSPRVLVDRGGPGRAADGAGLHHVTLVLKGSRATRELDAKVTRAGVGAAGYQDDLGAGFDLTPHEQRK